MPSNNHPEQDQKETLLTLLRETLNKNNELRKKYQIGEKFKFIRDQLQHLITEVETHWTTPPPAHPDPSVRLAEGEVLVYVYLFNAQGAVIRTWQKMLNPAVFYEYSVNRPIYADQKQIEAFIRSKHNKTQHAYLTIAIKQQDLLTTQTEEVKDAIGNPLIKVKEGALQFNRLLSFHYNEHEYTVSLSGELKNQ